MITSAALARFREYYVPLAWLGLLWAVGNAIYAYIVLDGARTYRVESAAYILAGVLLPLIFWRPANAGVHRQPALTDSDSCWLLLLAVGLWLLALAPFVALPFLSDDYVFLALYRRLPDVLRFGQFFRPMFALVFFALARIGGGSAVPFHVAGFVLHAASAWFVYVLGRRLFERTDAAAFCAAVFLTSPLQMEAVLWASGLQELLWTFFVLAALVVYTARATLTPGRLTSTVALMGCALLAKETAVAAALLVPATDWTYFRMKRGKLLPVAYAAVAALIVGYLAVRARVASIEAGFFVTPGRYFTQKFVATPYKFFVQPWNLTAAHVPAAVLCSAAVLAFAAPVSAVVRGSGPMLLAGPAVILISTLPVYSYFFVGADLRAARYVYFPAVGWALLITQLLTTLVLRRRTFAGAFAAFALVMFASLQLNLRPWRTAGEIVGEVESNLRQGRQPERGITYWQATYGEGFEVKDGIPTVYRGVNVFTNGYPELRGMVSAPPPPDPPIAP